MVFEPIFPMKKNVLCNKLFSSVRKKRSSFVEIQVDTWVATTRGSAVPSMKITEKVFERLMSDSGSGQYLIT